MKPERRAKGETLKILLGSTLLCCALILHSGTVLAASAEATGAESSSRPERSLGIPQSAIASRPFAIEAVELIKTGRAEEAYVKLSALEGDLAGNLIFDYLLGVAALDSAHYPEAIFALERATVTRPDFSGARMELARAHFEAGANERARQHFLRLLEEQPPEGVATAIDVFLAIIDERARRYQKRKMGWLNLRSGYDSNANGAVDQRTFLGFTLNENNTEKASTFLAIATGGMMSQPWGADLMIGGNFNLSHRFNHSASFVDSTAATAALTINKPEGDWRWTTSFGGYWSAVDHKFSERGPTVDLGLGRDLSDSWTLNSKMRFTAARFQKQVSVRDVNRYLFALTATHLDTKGVRPVQVKFSAVAGRDLATDRSSPYSNTKFGGRLSLMWLPVNNRQFGFDFGILKTRYDGDFFGSKKKDDQFSASAVHKWLKFAGKPWDLTARLSWIDNKSSVELSTYDRLEISLAAQRMVQ